MAAGLPVIGTAVGGIPDFLKNNETGMFCEVGNPNSIADKVKIILSDDILRKKLIANGQNLVKTKYDWDYLAIDMRNIFNQITEI
jgi:glycosyltransferase involved in cell wall biosynthesis